MPYKDTHNADFSGATKTITVRQGCSFVCSLTAFVQQFKCYAFARENYGVQLLKCLLLALYQKALPPPSLGICLFSPNPHPTVEFPPLTDGCEVRF